MLFPGSPQRFQGVSLQRDQGDHHLREGEEPEGQAHHQARFQAEGPAGRGGCGCADLLQPPALPEPPLPEDGEGGCGLKRFLEKSVAKIAF